jgi:hypothetical protein
MDVLDVSASVSYVDDKSSDWTKATSSFDSQLQELNSYNENNFEWQRVGEFIKPKTIKVVKLVKSLLSRNLVFSRVKREYYDAPFKRLISLNTFNNVYLPSNIQENVQRIEMLERLQSEIKTNLKLLNNSSSTLNEKLYSFDATLNEKYQLLSNRLLNSELIGNNSSNDLEN